jgi:putative membrane protein
VSEKPQKKEKEQGAETRHRRQQSKRRALAFDFLTPTNIPVELSFYIGSYIKACSTKQKVDPSTLTVMNNAVVSMIDCLTGFERILRTPIPLAYSIHLHHATWIYLLSLPFQLVSNMDELMIPAVMLAAFTLLGILGIGYEIENPFNDDYNDLPLDDFCKVIQAEVDTMVMHRAPVPSDWVFSENNYPLVNSRLSAKELSELTLDEVHNILEAEGRPTVHYTRNESGNVQEEAVQALNVQAAASTEPVPSITVEVPATTSNPPPKK